MIPKDKTLLPYQREALQTSLTWLKNSPSRAVYNGSDPGTGKSIMTVATLNALGFSKILIICPAIMRPTWQNEYREWTTQPHLRVNIIESSKCINKLSNPPQVLIISYDLAAKLPIANWLVRQGFQVLVLDEAHMCLEESTLISTPKGEISIKDLKEGDYVYSLSDNGIDISRIIIKHKGCSFEPKRRIFFENGKYIEGLDSHRIRTTSGWKEIGKVEILEEVLFVQKKFLCEKPVLFKDTQVLWAHLQESAQKIFTKKSLLEGMSLVSQNVRRFISQGSSFTNILQRKMCEVQSLSQWGVERTNDFPQSYEERIYTKEGKSDTKKNRASSKNSRWQWKTLTSTSNKIKKIMQDSISWSKNTLRVCYSNQNKKTFQKIPYLLQSRCSVTEYFSSFRSRWFESQFFQSETTRFEKRQEIEVSRVERIEILERTDNEKTTRGYYDFTLDKNHNYIANGVIVHNCGSTKAQRTKTILKVIWPSIPYRIPLSGTPFESNIISTYPVFSRCMPGHFGTKLEFGARYSNPILTPWGIQYKGVRNYEELKSVIKKNFFIRYKLEDVIKELPEISYKNIYLDKKYSHKEYERAIKEAVENGTITGDERIIPTHIMSLRKFQGELKIKPIAEFAELLLEQEIPIVIFPYHTCVIEGLAELLKKYKPVVIDGSTSPKAKQEAVDAFQGGRTNCFIGQIKSAGVGITLTRSSTVLLPEMPFEGSTIKQAVARVRRIGQKNAMVVHNFICQNSYDEKILKIVKDKADAFDKVFN